MVKPLHYATLLLVLAAQTGDASCNVTPKSCSVDTRGVQVEHGHVTDILTATCDQKPLTHRLEGWLIYRADPDQKYRRVGDPEVIRDRPDQWGVHLFLDAGPCVPGDYKAKWQANGLAQGEKPFSYIDEDYWPTHIDCTEG